MKYFKYSQYLYLTASIVFLLSVIYKIYTKQDYAIQAILTIGLVIMYFVRRSFMKKMENNQQNK